MRQVKTIQVATSVSGLPTLTYTRFYFRMANLSGTTLIALGQDASGHNHWVVYYDSARQGIDVYFWNGAGTRYDLYSSTNVLSTNTWYSVEIEANETTSGGGQVWLNGNSVASFTGDLSQTQGYSSLVLTNQSTGSIYFDDVVIAGSYNGLIGMNGGSSILDAQILPEYSVIGLDRMWVDNRVAESKQVWPICFWVDRYIRKAFGTGSR